MGAGRAFEVVNASVMATFVVAPATRLAAAMVMDTAVGVARAMMPLGAPADAVVSVSVCTVMPVVEPAVATPMVRPARVMVKGVLVAEMLAPAMVITNELAPGNDDVAVMAATDVPPELIVGCAEVAKNPEG